ncbi:MAG: hypothetical protein E7368_01090 [Clostridiales bacterium]|nr:hypothetical protein [Clostridiales bacterium]
MTNKIWTKAVNKKIAVLTLAITVVLLAVSIIVSVLCGVNYGAGLEDNKKITVTVNSFVYDNEKDTLEEVCENEFDKQGLSVKYEYWSLMSGDDREISFVFDVETEDEKVEKAKADLKATLEAEANNEESKLSGAIIKVSTGTEVGQGGISSTRVWRLAIAVGVFAVLAFAYVALRYRLCMGFVALLTPILSSALSTAVLLLTRIPVVNSSFYAISVMTFVATGFVLTLLNKIRSNAKTDAYKDADAETLIKGSLASKWIGLTAILLGVALVLVGAIATSAVRYFALASLVGLFVATVIGLVFAPSACFFVQDIANNRASRKTASGYVGAKKEDKE